MFETNFFKDIDNEIIGVDEVGRGALVGPVVSCALLLDKKIKNNSLHREINDSKKLTEKKRIILSEFIKENYFIDRNLNLKIPVKAIFHPDYLLRNPIEKKTTWDDLLDIDEFISTNNII